MSEKGVILLEDISLSQADTESLVGIAIPEVAVSPFLLVVPEKRVVDRGKESPVEGPHGPVKDVCETGG